jgi:16S rRNA processing protein RimM
MPTSERIIPQGKIVGTHGIEGWLKLNPHNPESQILRPPLEVILERETGQAAFAVESSRPHKRQILLKLQGIDRIETAEPWVGSVLGVSEKALPRLEPGEYYHYQVIGFEVFDIQGQRIGVVERTMTTPAGELFVVAGEFKEHLIPAVKEIVDQVDLGTGKIIVKPPPGLLDL